MIGYPMAMKIQMTAMPQRIAFSHAFGAHRRDARRRRRVPRAAAHGGEGTHRGLSMAALGFEVLLGSLTVTGCFMAFGKLQELDHRHGRSRSRDRTR